MGTLKYSEKYDTVPGQADRLVQETDEPVFLMTDDCTDMVLPGIEAHENLQIHNDVYMKLKEAEMCASVNRKTYTSKEVFSKLKKMIESPCAGSAHRIIP